LISVSLFVTFFGSTVVLLSGRMADQKFVQMSKETELRHLMWHGLLMVKGLSVTLQRIKQQQIPQTQCLTSSDSLAESTRIHQYKETPSYCLSRVRD
jgi:hypothetical protein